MPERSGIANRGVGVGADIIFVKYFTPAHFEKPTVQKYIKRVLRGGGVKPYLGNIIMLYINYREYCSLLFA